MKGTVVVIGGSNVDIEGKAVSQIRPFDSNLGYVIQKPGGVGRNIAENLARLNVNTVLISAVGDDVYGRWLREQCAQFRINIEHLLISQTVPTSTYLAVLDQAGEMQVAINDMGILDEITPALLAQKQRIIDAADILLIDCNLHQTSIDYIFQTFHDKTIFVDPVSSTKIGKITRYLKHITLLKPNLLEAATISGIGSEANNQELISWLRREGVQQIVISLGRDGVHYADRDTQGQCHISDQAPVVSGTGAGDALMAGLILGELKQLTITEKVRLGLAAAYITIQDEATVSPSINLHNVHEKAAQLNFNCH